MDMDPPRKKVAVVGGGFSGLFSIVMLKEENLEPVCFEKTDRVGGTWCYREESVIGVPSIMPTTILNHSKEMGAFSNFPPKKEYNTYMKHHEVYEYLMNYATKNDALKHVCFNSEVTDVRRSLDYEETGRWSVTVKNTLTGNVVSDIYDAVLICVGHINRPKWPSYPGLEDFKGEIIHTHSLKGVAKFENKNVVVIGMGCSGLDAAVEISSVAKQVYISTRSGSHIIARAGPQGYPFDYIVLRRFFTILIDTLPINIVSWLIENLIIDQKFNHRWQTVMPEWHVLSKDPVINDYIGSKMLTGAVKQKKDITKFTENGVIFANEDEVTEADVVIIATGYTWSFPFLEKDIIANEEGRIDLYKCMWPPHLKHPTLAVIGFILPFGPGFPLGEMQTRWAAHIFSGKGTLPTRNKMMRDIKAKHNLNLSRYAPSHKQTIRVDYVQYLEDIAAKLGVKPNLLKLLFFDPPLFLKLAFGPHLSYQYRLEGPHSWKGARQTIMTCEERMHYPVKRYLTKRLEHPFIVLIKKILQIFPFI
ncbi:dimethylaniline monooxygenase [N-oxide-forming] 2 isoform X3 [Parasteatoda tepidariorum]|uniref:dimethylaniline monooxygenase [N-oxide-forming] 2 isoform X2 n=1 Tax=Parasteatoda tepidariorum TaxID=114398 RepID=UPI001C7195A2|nr:dimethylaniline monooxygenase [N-oxide-forming] 2 isoform X3 [Parasteatoda tepidariorum]XP_042895042.1 dimethylaniline monooxygenase [N-oxide-forming] 2 isoform X4 [Parasteatoda tepidariorum]